MKNKGGRPQKLIKRDQQLPSIRVTSLEKEFIQLRAKKCGLSVAEYVRRSALNHESYLRLTTEEIEIYKELVNYKTGFSRIANLYKAEGVKENFTVEVHRMIQELKEHLLKFTK